MDNQRRRRFWTFGAIVFVLSTVLAIVWLTYSHHGKKKELLASQQHCGIIDITAHSQQQPDPIGKASPDNKILVYLDSYLQYVGNNNNNNKNTLSISEQSKTYLPLKLQRISMANETNGENSLILINDCARMSLNLATDSRELVVGSIDVETLKSNGFEKECHVLQTPIRLDTNDRYYSCNISSQYPCVARHWKDKNTFVTETVALLHLRSFEFEINGDPNVIKWNKFSKIPSICFT